MKVLVWNTFHLRCCGIWCIDENPKPIEKALKFFINFVFVFGNLLGMVFPYTMYIYRNPNNISGVVNALALGLGSLSILGSYLGFIANESTMKLLHRELQSVVNGGKLIIEYLD